MREDGTLDERERATMREAIEVVGRWLEAHRDERGTHPGYWGIGEAYRQLSENLWAMEE